MNRFNFCLVLLCSVLPLVAADPPRRALSTIPGFEGRPILRAERLRDGEKIELDGKLDEAAWKRAVPAADFLQQDPANGMPATEPTEVRILFDHENLYMGVYCYDSEPGKLRGNQMQRDGFLPADDRFMWTIDPLLNGINGYFFETNPSGAMGDSLMVGAAGGAGGGTTDVRGWDGIWYEKARRADDGWILEIRIPFRTLAFDPSAPAWGINFQRTVKRRNEESLWTGWHHNENLRKMTNAGLLTGLEEVTQGRGLTIQPYVIGRFLESPAQNQPPSFRGTGGGDLTYSLTPQLKANLTVNTDFAETEVDQRQVNLTQFALFYPEKRTFFLEGSQFLGFSREPDNLITPYFSRNIGINPDGTSQRVNFGAKVAGQVGAYDVGFLQVQTADSRQQSGQNFTVFRGRRRILKQSYIGGIFTRRADRLGRVDDQMTAGGDFSLATNHFRSTQNLELSGFYLWNTNLAHTGDNSAYGLRLDYPNDRWSARVSYREVQKNWNPSLGFQQRVDIRHYNPVVQFAPRPVNTRLVRRYVYSASLDYYTDTQNIMRTRQLDLNLFQVEFQTGDTANFHVQSWYDSPATDFNIYQNVVLKRNIGYTYTRAFVSVNTAQRRSVALNSFYSFGNFYSAPAANSFRASPCVPAAACW